MEERGTEDHICQRLVDGIIQGLSWSGVDGIWFWLKTLGVLYTGRVSIEIPTSQCKLNIEGSKFTLGLSMQFRKTTNLNHDMKTLRGPDKQQEHQEGPMRCTGGR